MTFRLRVFLLVVLVAVTAIGATVFLTLSLASREVSRSQEATRQHSSEIIEALKRYGLLHGRWNGVTYLAQQLAADADVQFKLQTTDGTVLVDTAVEAGRVTRQVEPEPTPIIGRPKIDMALLYRDSAGVPPRALAPTPTAPTPTAQTPAFQGTTGYAPRAIEQLAAYRTAIRVVRCINLKTEGVIDDVLLLSAMPYLTEAQRVDNPDCVKKAVARAEELNEAAEDALAFAQCDDNAKNSPYRDCWETTFDDQLSGSGAWPIELYFGVVETAPQDLLSGTALIAVAGLIAVAVIGTALVARQFSRPVHRLTSASLLLAAGELDIRVPTTGGGELAQLSRSFNAMAEAVQRSENRQRRLVADVAHELRTPLSNLRGYLEGLQDGVVEPSRELFVSLHEETLLQGRILDDLQVLALAEVGSLVYDRTAVDLAELAENGVTAHGAVAAEAGLRLVVDAPAPVWINADPDRLRQVLGNLLTNAIRYTPARGEVLVRAVAANGGALLSVSDTGTGIGPDDLPHVFDRFWRADPARQRATGGSGLGLTIAKQIVVDHGGKIRVTSTLGVGTTFTALLPPEAVVLPPHQDRT